VSVQALRNPLSDKALKLLKKAEDETQKRDRVAAAKTLESALVLQDARPFALLMVGSEHLGEYFEARDPKLLRSALAELEEAVPQLPGEAAGHSNLALALHLKGDEERALREANKALQLDPARPKTRYVIGMILIEMGKISEALFHLKLAAPKFPDADQLVRTVTAASAKR
jgi:tetratricopeptide (TPR) repeat protein